MKYVITASEHGGKTARRRAPDPDLSEEWVERAASARSDTRHGGLRVGGGVTYIPMGESSEGQVTVVIPTIGRPSVVAAVESVLGQTLRPAEVIVAVDGAERLDAVRDVLGEFDGHPVTVVTAPRAGHPGPVRNAGLQRVTTALVAFLDDDDTWAEHKLAEQVGRFRTGVVAVASNALQVAPDGERPYFTQPVGGTLTLRDFVRRNPLVTSSVVCRTEVLRRVGGFPGGHDVRGVEDYVAWVKLATQGSVVVVDRLLVRYAAGSPDRVSVSTARTDPVSVAIGAACRDLCATPGTGPARAFLRASLVRRRIRPRSRMKELLRSASGR